MGLQIFGDAKQIKMSSRDVEPNRGSKTLSVSVCLQAWGIIFRTSAFIKRKRVFPLQN